MSDEKNRIFILELVLHCADISNPFKPFDICESWALLVVEEFFAQGDREKREGFPVSPMMDRNTVILCNMQMGFIEFAVAPLISTFVKIFPGLYEIVMHMRDNFCAWGEKRKAEVTPFYHFLFTFIYFFIYLFVYLFILLYFSFV
jgi:hypothetical protein